MFFKFRTVNFLLNFDLKIPLKIWFTNVYRVSIFICPLNFDCKVPLIFRFQLYVWFILFKVRLKYDVGLSLKCRCWNCVYFLVLKLPLNSDLKFAFAVWFWRISWKRKRCWSSFRFRYQHLFSKLIFAFYFFNSEYEVTFTFRLSSSFASQNLKLLQNVGVKVPFHSDWKVASKVRC